MTALNLAEIPSNINTLEQLAAWSILALARCNASIKILEEPNAASQRAAQAVLIRADDGSFRLVGRVSLQVADSYSTNTQKFWFNVQPLSDTVLPAAFKSNT